MLIIVKDGNDDEETLVVSTQTPSSNIQVSQLIKSAMEFYVWIFLKIPPHPSPPLKFVNYFVLSLLVRVRKKLI